MKASLSSISGLKAGSPWVILTLCVLNLLAMHYYILGTCTVEGEYNFTTTVDNAVGVVADVVLLFLVFYYGSWKRLRAALSATFAVTWLWSFSNVMYSRFFHHYLSLSAVGQGGTLLDWQMLRCVIDGFSPFDIFFLAILLAFTVLIRKARPTGNIATQLAIVLIIAVCVDLASYGIYCSLAPERRYVSFFLQRIENRQFSTQLHLSDPNNTAFRRGTLRTLLYEFALNSQGAIELTEEQRGLIAAETEAAKSDIAKTTGSLTGKNVIFIIVESYMSFTSDMSVGGREVTPCLNSLKRDTATYFNAQMRENVTVGESSDGQFVYMTGILPLRSVITVSKARHVTLPGLPKALGMNARMVIPTTASMWNQDEMCTQYGFDALYTSSDYPGQHSAYLTDEQVFKLAMDADRASQQPFLSVVLTMSMHQPYTEQRDTSFIISDPTITNDLACYLNACHYTDRQIGMYIEHLKRTGLYDNSIIVIAADHPVHNTDLGGADKHIPLYIVNPAELPDVMWQGECNQLDVYTTLLDIMGCDADWVGLGRSLASPTYNNDIRTQSWDVSEWIIMGDYFSSLQPQ